MTETDFAYLRLLLQQRSGLSLTADKQYLGSSFSPTFRKGQGWITAGRTGGFGADGNADVFGILVRDGKLSRMVNLTRSEKWDSGPGWGVHPSAGSTKVATPLP